MKNLIISDFLVVGFKNFVEPIHLVSTNLLDSVLGTNNVGKSNLLMAIHCYGKIRVNLYHPYSANPYADSNPYYVDDDKFQKHFGYSPNDLFTLNGNNRITFNVTERLIVGNEYPPKSELFANVVIQLKRVEYGVEIKQFIEQANSIKAMDWFVDVIGTGDIVPQHVCDALFESKQAHKQDEVLCSYWDNFVESMRAYQFEPFIGEGEFNAIVNRDTGQAELVFDTNKTRMRLCDMGNGIQQVVSLFGQLHLADTSIVLIDTPERGMSYDLQVIVSKMIKPLIARHPKINQVIFCSNSPAFQWGDTFFGMANGDVSPVLAKEPIDNLQRFSGMPFSEKEWDYKKRTANHLMVTEYVSSDGFLLLPDYVRRDLDVLGGGNIGFRKNNDGRYELLTMPQMDMIYCGFRLSESD